MENQWGCIQNLPSDAHVFFIEEGWSSIDAFN